MNLKVLSLPLQGISFRMIYDGCFFVGTNITFFLMHFAGTQGVPGKILDYPDYFVFCSAFFSFLRISFYNYHSLLIF